ncbi:hypothetical protein [Streptomyces milbemycinicus]|uniref:hypothetical protein n=1 Tax=Streptomyces milbemycinicus TaxID=476552 RepID=UPI0033E413F0
MTDLFAVSIDSVEECTVRGRLHIINPDAAFVPKSAPFPLALLVDAWFLLSNGFLRDGDGMPDRPDRYPYSPERGKEIVAGMRMKDEFRELYDAIRGKKIRVTDDGYLLADDGISVLIPRRTAKAVYGEELGSGSGHDGVSRYVLTRSDAYEFYDRAAEIVTSYEKSPIRNVPLWSEVVALEHPDQPWEEGDLDDIAGLEGEADLSEWQTWMLVGTRPFEELPYSDFTFTVSHPAYLEHVVGGMRWSTTHTGRV